MIKILFVIWWLLKIFSFWFFLFNFYTFFCRKRQIRVLFWTCLVCNKYRVWKNSFSIDKALDTNPNQRLIKSVLIKLSDSIEYKWYFYSVQMTPPTSTMSIALFWSQPLLQLQILNFIWFFHWFSFIFSVYFWFQSFL